MVANIARYHRKSFPSVEHEPYKILPAKDRVIVSKLAALLRIADALDTEHAGKVTHFGMEYDRPRLFMKLQGQGDLLLERWALAKRSLFFEEVFGAKLSIVE
jgi:exopolyphosphatase/guanosine-5'-triphosphate,3'-diphosphate pyrophosphatase